MRRPAGQQERPADLPLTTDLPLRREALGKAERTRGVGWPSHPFMANEVSRHPHWLDPALSDVAEQRADVNVVPVTEAGEAPVPVGVERVP